MTDLIDYTVIVTIHYRLPLLCFRRGGTKRILEGSDKSRLRGCCGIHCRSSYNCRRGHRRRQRPRCCRDYW